MGNAVHNKKWKLTIAGWFILALLYVVAMLDGHSSRYHGLRLSKVAELMLNVYTDVVYPSAEQLSCLQNEIHRVRLNSRTLARGLSFPGQRGR